MRHRDFTGRSFAIAGAASVLVVIAFAPAASQIHKTAHIGFLSAYSADAGEPLLACFRKALKAGGWSEDQNLRIDTRWAGGQADRYAAYAKALNAEKLDAVAVTSTPATQSMKAATQETKTPVVFMNVSDPVASNIVASLARPGGNVTGISNFLPATAGKLVEFSRSLAPHTRRIKVVRDPNNPGKTLDVRAMSQTGQALGIAVEDDPVKGPEDIDRSFRELAADRPDAVIVLLDGVTLSNRQRIVRLAKQYRLVALYESREFVVAGGLISYGLNVCAHFKRGAAYMDRILRGTAPGDLPVELPTTFEMVINAKAAREIGIEIPPSLAALADDVID